jgi:hypothetical protein
MIAPVPFPMIVYIEVVRLLQATAPFAVTFTTPFSIGSRTR